VKTGGSRIRNIPIFSIAVALLALAIGCSASDAKSRHVGIIPQAEVAYFKAVELAGHRDTLHAAVRPIAEAVRLEPQNATYWSEQANILHDLEEDEVAIASIKKALAINNKAPGFWRIDSLILTALKRLPEALAAADNSIKLGGDVDSHIQRASVLIYLSRFSESVQELNLVLKQNPHSSVARESRMIAAEHLGDYKSYLSDCNYFLRSPKLQAQDAKMLLRRAKAHTRLKHYDKAISDYKAALKLMPDLRQAHAGLLEVYNTINDTTNSAKETAFLKKLDKDLGF
jgi:tetratricopeptide (TPR) repeat protein